jgi:N-acetyl-gamma-glutamyl-phosphate reductase
MELQNVAVVGATGYSGEELIRILMRHPGVELVAVTSRQHVGEPLESVFPKFQAHKFSELKFIHSDAKTIVDSGAKFAFLALPHGLAHDFAKPLLDAGVRVIDLSADFRLKDVNVYENFYGHKHPAPELLAESVYGMPEIYRDKIRGAKLIASPGCYPTSIILPLFPLLKKNLLDAKSIVVSSMSGVSGAGRKAEVDYLFVECNESVRAYSVPKHRHLSEIEQELSSAAGENIVINFTPHLIPVNRGICTTIFARPRAGVTAQEISGALTERYKDEVFVRLQGEKKFADIKNVAHSNFIDIAWRHDPRTGRVVLLSAIDNLVKGASGQAVQSFNLMCGWPESVAL